MVHKWPMLSTLNCLWMYDGCKTEAKAVKFILLNCLDLRNIDAVEISGCSTDICSSDTEEHIALRIGSPETSSTEESDDAENTNRVCQNVFIFLDYKELY